MTPPTAADDLPVFALTEEAGRIPPTDPELALAVPASARPVWLHGARTSVLTDVRGPCREVRIDGRRVVVDLTVESGPVANAVVAPGLLRRERLSASGSTLETVLVAPGIPLVVVELRGPGAVRVELTALPDEEEARWRVDGSAVTVGGANADELLVVATLPGTGAWTARTTPERGVRLTCAPPTGTVDSPADGVRVLVLAWGSEAGVRTALAGARHLAGHATRAGARPSGDRLALRSGAAGLDDAVDWMQHRLAAGVRVAAAAGASPARARERAPVEQEAGSGSTMTAAEAWMWSGLGACAVGDADTASACVRTLDEMGCPEEALLVAARLALTTGRQDPLVARIGNLGSATAAPTALGRLARRTAADALRHAAPEALLDGLRRSGASPAPPEAPPPGGRRLPTVGGARSTGGPAIPSDASGEGAAYLLEGGGPHRRPEGSRLSPGPARSALEAWTALAAGDPDGWARWRGIVAAGVEGTEGGVAVWDAVDPTRPPAATGILLAAMTYGWLGARPDAPVGRLSLSPTVPAHLTAFRFRGVRVGDATLDLGYRREGSLHRFELDPRGGRVPPLVVFEPIVPVVGVEEVRVDGAPAEVEAEPSPNGTRVRLQTPLDQLRRVEIRAR